MIFLRLFLHVAASLGNEPLLWRIHFLLYRCMKPARSPMVDQAGESLYRLTLMHCVNVFVYVSVLYCSRAHIHHHTKSQDISYHIPGRRFVFNKRTILLIFQNYSSLGWKIIVCIGFYVPQNMALKQISSNKCCEGFQKVFEHDR